MLFKPNRLSFITYAPDKGTSGDPGVNPPPATGNDETGDSLNSGNKTMAELQAEVAELKAAQQRDVNKLKSTYDRQTAALQKQVEAYQNRSQESSAALLERLSPEDKVTYLANQLAQERALHQQEMQQTRQSQQDQQAIQNTVQSFAQFGISADDINTSSPETAARTGWIALVQKFRTLENAGKQPNSLGDGSESNPDQLKPVDQNNSRVETSPSGGTRAPAVTPEALLYKAAVAITGKKDITWIEVDDLIEAGRLDPNTVLQPLKG